MKRTVLYLSMLMLASMLTDPAYAEKAQQSKIKWHTNASLDFAEVESIYHSSKFISQTPFFSIIGRPVKQVEGFESVGIQGVYASQDPQVLSHCLNLAAEINLKREGDIGARLRVQVVKDPNPAYASFAQIQFCSLTHVPAEKD